jgi:hypothetical protein
MKKYVASSPEAEVVGQMLLAIVESVYSERIMPVLEQHGITDVDPAKWYSWQTVLDFSKTLASDASTAMGNLVSVGMKVSDASAALLPPEVDSIPAMFSILNTLYNTVVRSHNGEGYEFKVLGDRHVQLVDNNPMPHDLVYGIVYGFARRFNPPGGALTVKRDYLNPDSPDADGAVYDITW